MSKHILQHLQQADPTLAALIERAGPFKLKPRRLPPFRSLTQAIIFQQLHGKAADTILRRFCGLFGDSEFPSPEQVLEAGLDRLRTAGLSRAKASYILDLAARARSQSLPTLAECKALADEEIIARLTEVKGVGRWTAEMFLMFNLGRPDVLPVGDFGVRRGFMVAWGKRKLPAPETLRRYGARWKPYRTAASWYLWRAADAA
jgi:DNA-3-methyladenine glycosylase II